MVWKEEIVPQGKLGQRYEMNKQSNRKQRQKKGYFEEGKEPSGGGRG